MQITRLQCWPKQRYHFISWLLRNDHCHLA